VSRPGRILVLNGTSSAGKSTLARILQDRWTGPLLDAGLDRHLAMLPRRYLGAAWPEVYRYRYHDDGTIAEIGMGPVGDRLYRGMHRAVAALARSGTDVVADHVLLDRSSAVDLARAVAGLPAVLVGVRLEEPHLSERERSRGDRTLGQAAAQLAAVHAHGPYDVEVDTARLTPDDAAEVILSWLADGRPSALERIAAAG
jgi:chloramphenicol 3-O phosphotransferase